MRSEPGVAAVGSIAIHALHDGAGAIPADAFFPFLPLERRAELGSLVGADGKVGFPIGAFLVETSDRLIMVDAGVGPRQSPTQSGGLLLESLRAAGFEAEAVTDVVLTHLHSDHTGWVFHHGEVTFPRATYRCHEADWNHFVHGAGRPVLDQPLRSAPGFALEDGTRADLLLAVADRLVPWSGDETLSSGVDLWVTAGHTPGSTSIVVSDGDQRAMLIGDVAHCPVEFEDADFSALGDHLHDEAVESRHAVAKEAMRMNALVSGAHFTDMRFGRISELGDGRLRWSPS